MKKLTLLVLVVMLLSVALVACGEDHVHTFSADWSKNDTQHWNAATCEHSSEVDNKADHVDINNDKICDVCAYDYNHEHAYSADWTYDAENHWNAASCGCTIAPKNVAAHADENNDGACDVCGHIASLSHTFAADWSTDAENHWKAALCGHDVVAEKAAHTLDAYGICSVCAYNAGTVDVTTLTLEEAIALGLARADVVVNGSFVEVINTDTRKQNTNLVYKFGDGFLFVSSQLDLEVYNRTLKKWFPSEEDKSTWYYAFGDGAWSVVEQDGVLSKNPDTVTADNLVGYMFDGSFFGYKVDASYGIEAYLNAIYTYAKALPTFAAAEEGFGFSFTTGEGEDAVTYTVSFALNAESYFVESVSMTRTSDGATFDLEQSNVYDDDANRPENLLPTSFELYLEVVDEETFETSYVKIEDALNVILGENVTIAIRSILPEGFDLSFDTVLICDAEGNVLEWPDYGSFDAWGETVSAMFTKAGEYTLVIKTTLYEASVDFVATAPAVSEINPTVDGETTNAANVYVGESLVIDATVNRYANGEYTITFETTDGATLVQDEETGVWTFSATAAGTYTITFVSVENAEITATLVLTVNELTEVDVDTFFNTVYTGKDEWDWAEMKVVFAPDMLDATTGTVEITITTSWNADSFTYNYVYNEDTRKIKLTYDGEFDMLGVTLEVNGDATLSAYQMGTKFNLVPGGDDEEINSMFFNGKTYTFTDKDGKVWYLRFTYYEPAYEGAPERYYLLLCDAVSGRYQNGWGYDYEYKEINIPGRPVMPAITFVYDGNGIGTVPELYNLVYDALNDTIAVTDAYVTDNAADPYIATRYEGPTGGR